MNLTGGIKRESVEEIHKPTKNNFRTCNLKIKSLKDIFKENLVQDTNTF